MRNTFLGATAFLWLAAVSAHAQLPGALSSPGGQAAPAIPQVTVPPPASMPSPSPMAPSAPLGGRAGVSAGGTSSYQQLTLPGAPGAIMEPNGNGTSTVITPGGGARTVVTPR